MLGGKGVEIETLKAATSVSGDKSQEQDQGVAIAAKGVHAHAAKRGQIHQRLAKSRLAMRWIGNQLSTPSRASSMTAALRPSRFHQFCTIN